MTDSDDDIDPELIELLRQSLHPQPDASPSSSSALPYPPSSPSSSAQNTQVLSSARYITDQAVDVALDSRGTKAAAQLIHAQMQRKAYSTKTWSTHELHPRVNDDDGDEKRQAVVGFIFTMDLLNFCFWSKRKEEGRFAVEYNGRRWTGYWSLVAALRRAVDEGIPITTPSFWVDHDACPDDTIRHVFRSCTDEDMPLLDERIRCLREAGQVLCAEFESKVTALVSAADKSAVKLINLLVTHFPSTFRDVFPSPFDNDDEDNGGGGGGSGALGDERKCGQRELYFLKRAQILVADLWACFDGKSYGEFSDIQKVTMFADYRIPQMLHALGCISYSPPLEAHIRALKEISSGHSWEIQIRGCSIWTVELLRRQIQRLIDLDPSKPHQSQNARSQQPAPDVPDDANQRENPKEQNDNKEEKEEPIKINAILIDFFLYDTLKEQVELQAGKNEDAAGGPRVREDEMIPHHRVRSIWY